MWTISTIHYFFLYPNFLFVSLSISIFLSKLLLYQLSLTLRNSKPQTTHTHTQNQPNEIPAEDHKYIEHKHTFPKSTSTSSTTSTTTESATESIEHLLIAPTLPPAEDEEVSTLVASEVTSTPAAEPLKVLAPPLSEVVTAGEESAIESIGQAAALTASLPISEDIVRVEQSSEASEKNDAHQEAAKLLLAGVQLTSHNDEQHLERNEVVVTSTTTTSPITPVMVTSTEVVTEISSTQERIRGYRRNRPGVMLKRAHIRPLPTVRTTTAATTPRSTTPTRSYLERLAASRLRLSRLSQATRSSAKATTTLPSTTTTPATTTTVSSFQQIRGGAEPGPNKRLTVRDIDRETKVAPSKANWETVHSNLQRFQVQRGNRVYTPATRASVSSSNAATTSSTTSAPRSYIATTSSRATVNVNRGKNRYSNFKTQAPVQRTRGTTTTSTTQRPTSSLSSLNQHISALASNYNGGYSYNQATQISKPIPQSPSHVYATHTASDIAGHASQSQTTSSLTPASAFLSFDKLTRAIVDESVLQNFKSAQSQGSNQAQQNQRQQQQQHQVAKQQHHSVSSSYVKPAAAPGKELSKSGYGLRNKSVLLQLFPVWLYHNDPNKHRSHLCCLRRQELWLLELRASVLLPTPPAASFPAWPLKHQWPATRATPMSPSTISLTTNLVRVLQPAVMFILLPLCSRNNSHIISSKPLCPCSSIKCSNSNGNLYCSSNTSPCNSNISPCHSNASLCSSNWALSRSNTSSRSSRVSTSNISSHNSNSSSNTSSSSNSGRRSTPISNPILRPISLCPTISSSNSCPSSRRWLHPCRYPREILPRDRW